MKKILLALLAISPPAFAVTSGISPSSVMLTVYGVAISPNTDCSNATVVSNFPGGVQFDFTKNPALFSGNIASGTYPCVILKMSDVITYTPATTSDNNICVAGQPITRDICRAGSGSFTPTTFNADGTVTLGATQACTGSLASPANDQPALFLSTGSTGRGNNAFQQPTTATNGIALGAPFVVTGSNAATFVINFGGQIKESGGNCDNGPATFSFR